jgi:ankyrin repeat protein
MGLFGNMPWTTPQARLARAAARGDVAAAEAALAEGARVDGENNEALIRAAEKGQEAMLRFLIGNGADPAARGNIPMDNALAADNAGVARILRRHGAPPAAEADRVLYEAIIKASPSRTALAVAAGGHRHRLVTDAAGEQAIHSYPPWHKARAMPGDNTLIGLAHSREEWDYVTRTLNQHEGFEDAKLGHFEVLWELVKDEPILEARDTAAAAALFADRQDRRDALLAKEWRMGAVSGHMAEAVLLHGKPGDLARAVSCGLDLQNCGDRIFFTAGALGKTEILDEILAAGGDFNQFGHRALAVAIERGHADLAGRLMEMKPDLSGSNGAAVLAAAVSKGDMNLIGRLLRAGADIDADNGAALTAASNNWDMVLDLLDQGADPLAGDGGALKSLLSSRHSGLMGRVLSTGADPAKLSRLVAEASRSGGRDCPAATIHLLELATLLADRVSPLPAPPATESEGPAP